MTHMGLPGFNELSGQDQLDELYKEGIFLGKLRTYNQSRVLYFYDGFYGEIIYTRYRREVKLIRCFLGTELLDPYLQQLKIEELIDC